MNGRKGTLLSLLMLAATASPLIAQQDTTPKQHAPTVRHAMRTTTPGQRSMYPRLVQERPGLLAQTTVAPDSATHVALRGMEGARVVARRLVKRGDNLVYVISVRPKGARASKRIDVDAKTGAVLPTTPTKPKASGRRKAPTKPKGR